MRGTQTSLKLGLLSKLEAESLLTASAKVIAGILMKCRKFLGHKFYIKLAEI